MEIVSRFFFFFILCNFIAIFFSAWPSHLARLVLAISKWLCSFFIVTFSLCMYLSIVNFSGHEIKIVVVVVVSVSKTRNYMCILPFGTFLCRSLQNNVK